MIENQSFGITDYPFDSQRFKILMGNIRTTIFTAVHDDRVVGYICAVFGKKTAYIYSFAVLKAYRGNGIGTALLEEVEKQALTLGFKDIQLEVRWGSKAVAMYENRGYFVKYIRKNYYGVGRHAYHMEKQLPGWGCNDETINTAGTRDHPADAAGAA